MKALNGKNKTKFKNSLTKYFLIVLFFFGLSKSVFAHNNKVSETRFIDLPKEKVSLFIKSKPIRLNVNVKTQIALDFRKEFLTIFKNALLPELLPEHRASLKKLLQQQESLNKTVKSGNLSFKPYSKSILTLTGGEVIERGFLIHLKY